MSVLFPWLDPALWQSLAAPNLVPSNLSQSILPGWSFLTVNEGNSTAPDTERRIVAQDSYGRQIGRLMDAVDVLVKEAEARNPALKDNESFKKLETLKTRVDAAKAEAQDARRERLVADLLALKRHSKTEFNDVISAVTP